MSSPLRLIGGSARRPQTFGLTPRSISDFQAEDRKRQDRPDRRGSGWIRRVSGEVAPVGQEDFQIEIGGLLSRPRKRQAARVSRKGEKVRPTGSEAQTRPQDSHSTGKVRDGGPTKSGDNSRRHRYIRRYGPGFHRWPPPRGEPAERFRRPKGPPSCASRVAPPSEGVVDLASDDSKTRILSLLITELPVKLLSLRQRDRSADPVGTTRRVAPYMSVARYADNWTVASHADKINRAM